MISFNKITLCFSVDNSQQATERPVKIGDGEKWSNPGYILKLELTEILEGQIWSEREKESTLPQKILA